MSLKYPGGFVTKASPTVTGPTDGEGGSAPGIWTLKQQADYASQGLWPKPILQGQLWSWGGNGDGQLGLGNTVDRSSPNQIGSLSTWAKVSGGNKFAIVVKSDGTLWTWGANSAGQLGLGNTVYRSSPNQVGALTTWANTAGGAQFSAAIKTDGTLWSWGSNSHGQLGLGNVTYYSSPKQVGALTTWLTLAAGRYFMAATKTDGSLWSWGRNNFGQLGLGNVTDYSSPKQIGALTTWSKVICGWQHVLATKTDGTLWSWGYNLYGQLGLGNTTYYSSPKQIGALTTWGASLWNGVNSSVAIKTDGSLWSWGRNNFGQLGLGNTTNYSSPKQVGALTTWTRLGSGYPDFATKAVQADGTLWSWGYNFYGQLGLGNTTDYSSPKQVGALTTWLKVASLYTSTLAIKSS